MNKRIYFVKDYVVGEETPVGIDMPIFIKLIPDLGITMKPKLKTPRLKINAYYIKSRRKEYYKILCEVLEAK